MFSAHPLFSVTDRLLRRWHYVVGRHDWGRLNLGHAVPQGLEVYRTSGLAKRYLGFFVHLLAVLWRRVSLVVMVQ